MGGAAPDAHVLPTPPAPGADVPRRTFRATAALLARQVVVQGLNALVGVLLARWLSPAEFGVWGIVTFGMSVFLAVGDLGLGAGLVRDLREPDDRDYRAVLALQHALTIVIGVGLALAAPALAAAYGLSDDGVTLFRLIAVSAPIGAIQTVSSIRLERGLSFGRLMVVETAQAVAYHLTLLTLVRLGVGIVGFGWALLVRSVVGATLAFALAPWRIGWRLDLARARALLAFGLPYQGVSLVSLVKDALTPIWIAALLGTAAVGQVNWAQMVAAYPVLALMAMQRVYLPGFARLQHDPARLADLVENVLRMTNAIVAPLAVTTLALIEPAVRIVFGESWRAAVPLFRLLWFANLFVPTATPVAGLLNALGLSRTTFGFALLWMAMTWVLGLPAVRAWGVLGFGLTNLAVQLTVFPMAAIARRRIPFRVLPAVVTPWGLAGAIGIALAAVQRARPVAGAVDLIGYAAAGLLLYGLGLGLVWRDRVRLIAAELRGVRA